MASFKWLWGKIRKESEARSHTKLADCTNIICIHNAAYKYYKNKHWGFLGICICELKEIEIDIDGSCAFKEKDKEVINNGKT